MHGLDGLPAEWKAYTHVDGKMYFQHPTWRVVTEAYVQSPDIRAKLEEWYHEVNAARSKKIPVLDLSEKQELYLTLDPQPGYYFVDHNHLSVFWLDETPMTQLGAFPGMSFGECA